MPTIGFLHTSPTHIDTFDQLVIEHAPSFATTTFVDESILTAARTYGADAEVVLSSIDHAIDELVAAGATKIVCTCSTIARLAEKQGQRRGIDVIGVDRPMAEAAVSAGRRITVLAALQSTLKPTADLLEQVATSCRAKIDVTIQICDGSWDLFEAGDHDAYADSIARVCDDVADGSDVIVLAQASMSGAVQRCSTTVPVLSSPNLAVQRATMTA